MGEAGKGGEGGGKIRDAERSREAILGAAGALFAERGFDGVSLGEIAAGAGLSRGSPSYFFGSKAELHRAVLERAFAEREAATARACAPLLAWAADGDAPLRDALGAAVSGYLEFLAEHPTFLRLIEREALDGAPRLARVPRSSKAIEEAFAAVLAVAPERGLGQFEVADAVLVFVSLTFFPLAQRSAFMASLGRDLDRPAVRRRHVELVVDQLLGLVG